MTFYSILIRKTFHIWSTRKWWPPVIPNVDLKIIEWEHAKFDTITLPLYCNATVLWFCCYINTLFVLLLSHFWLIHFFPPAPALWTISRPLSSSMCSITPETANVGSSHNNMRGIGCWFSERSNCSHWSLTLAFTLISEKLSLYTTLLLYWSLYNYAAHAADISTPTTVAQSVNNHSWGLYCRRCYCIRVCWDVPVGYSTFHVDMAS